MQITSPALKSTWTPTPAIPRIIVTPCKQQNPSFNNKLQPIGPSATTNRHTECNIDQVLNHNKKTAMLLMFFFQFFDIPIAQTIHGPVHQSSSIVNGPNTQKDSSISVKATDTTRRDWEAGFGMTTC